MRVELSIVINRPVEEVFAYVANPENDPAWAGPVVVSRITSEPPIGVGTTAYQEVNFMGRRAELQAEVTQYVEDRLLHLRNTGGMKGSQTRTFEPAGDGTRFTLVMEGEVPSALRFMEGMATRAIRRQTEADLEKLKAFLEDGTPPAL